MKVIENRNVEIVHWRQRLQGSLHVARGFSPAASLRIENAEDVRSRFQKARPVGFETQKMPGSRQGEYLASPEFSAGGLGGFCFHFYPRGRSHYRDF